MKVVIALVASSYPSFSQSKKKSYSRPNLQKISSPLFFHPMGKKCGKKFSRVENWSLVGRQAGRQERRKEDLIPRTQKKLIGVSTSPKRKEGKRERGKREREFVAM